MQRIKAAADKASHRYAKLGGIVQPVLDLQKKEEQVRASQERLEGISAALARIYDRC